MLQSLWGLGLLLTVCVVWFGNRPVSICSIPYPDGKFGKLLELFGNKAVL
jgi:hypothetical protein